MKKETRWSYEQRIKNQRLEIERLRPYEILCRDLFNWMSEKQQENKILNQGWMMGQFKEVFK